MKKIILIMIALALISSVNAWSNNSFNNTLTNENMTFVGNQNITRYLEIPENVILTNAYLNLSGYYDPHVSSSTYDGGNADQKTNISTYGTSNNQDYGYDDDADTFAYLLSSGGGQYALWYLNWTWDEDQPLKGTWAVKWKGGQSGTTYYYECYSKTQHTWITESAFVCSGAPGPCTGLTNYSTAVTIDNPNCFDQSPLELRLRVLASTGGVFSWIYEMDDSLTWYNSTYNYTDNISVSIDDQQGYYYPGEFNQQNNMTDNLASLINSYLGSCSYLSGYCFVPNIFHSDDSGIIEYLDMSFDNIGFLENSQTYNSTTYESKTESYLINLTYDSNYYTGITGTLYYNGSSYSGTKTGSGNNIIFSRSLTIPQGIGTNDFYWTITLTNSSGSFKFNSSTNQQTVNSINLSECTSGSKFLTLNIKDEEDLSFLTGNTTIKLTFLYYSDSISENFTLNSSISSNNVSFCFQPVDQDVKIFGEIEYESDLYVSKFYYILHETFSNDTTTIDLYDLLASSSTSYIIYLYDSSSVPLDNGYIKLKKKYLDLNEFKTVEMTNTDEFGIGILHFIEEDEIYKAEIYDESGTLLYITDEFKATCLDTVCSLSFELPYEYEVNPFQGIGTDDNFNYYLNITNSSVYLDYQSLNGSDYDIQFNVYAMTIINDTITICTESETNVISGSITCDISGSSYETYLVYVWVNGELEITEYLNRPDDDAPDHGNNGLIIAIFLVITLAVLLIWHWALCLLGAVAGLLISMWFGFIAGTIASISYLIVVVLYIIFYGGKRS